MRTRLFNEFCNAKKNWWPSNKKNKTGDQFSKAETNVKKQENWHCCIYSTDTNLFNTSKNGKDVCKKKKTINISSSRHYCEKSSSCIVKRIASMALPTDSSRGWTATPISSTMLCPKYRCKQLRDKHYHKQVTTDNRQFRVRNVK